MTSDVMSSDFAAATASSGREAGPFLSLKGVLLRSPNGAAWPPIDWEIRSDQQWAVVGANGSGKSALMKAISGQAPPGGGEIVYHFAGNGGSPLERIAYVAFDAQRPFLGQESPFHQARWNSGVMGETLSVSEVLSERQVRRINPYQVLEGAPDPAAFSARRARTIELLGLEALLERAVVQISNGERRKVLLARALLQDLRLLILDNPFAGLDAEFRARLKEIVGGLMDDRLRVVLVTSGREEIPPEISHVLWMEAHAVVAAGPREAVLGRVAARSPGATHIGRCVAPREEHAPGEDAEQEPGAQGQVLVQMEQVSVAYDGVQVLSRIDWTVRQGEHWAVLGPNGAGKSTLLSLILGDNPQAYANEVTLFGQRRGSGETIWEVKRRIGWVAPELQLTYPRQVSCLEVVCSGFFDSVGCYRRPSAGQRAAALEAMERLGIEDLAGQSPSGVGGKPFGAISEGQQRLVLMARALVKRPLLLVLDEPCQGLDAGNRDRVLEAVEAVGDGRQRSVIYVTHHRDALPGIITHVLRLKEGRVVGRGARLDSLRSWRSHGGRGGFATNYTN
jgi:molybdate transport system ATP-binding protein